MPIKLKSTPLNQLIESGANGGQMDLELSAQSIHHLLK